MNLLFITTDHQRFDSINMVQAGREVTPRLNALARTGTFFGRTYTTCPLCVPARTSLATGLSPFSTGVTFNDWTGSCARDVRPLHQLLSDAGHRVAHVGMDHVKLNPPLRQRVRFSHWHGVEEVERDLGDRNGPITRFMEGPLFKTSVSENAGNQRVQAAYSNTNVAVWPFAAGDFRDVRFARAAGETLVRLAAGTEPFSLFVNFWAPHPPLVVPQEYLDRFPPKNLTLPPNVGIPAAGEPSSRRQAVPAQLAHGITDEQWRCVWGAHLALTNLVDECIGDVLDALESSGRASDTLVVFTSDHGDHLGQHSMYQKMECYDQAVRVPMIFSGPGIAPREEADVPVSHLDVVPTIADLLNLPRPARLDGCSLADAVRGLAATPNRPVFFQYRGNIAHGDERFGVVLRHHKLVVDASGGRELFDLRADPLETVNRSGDPDLEPLERELESAIAAWRNSGSPDSAEPSLASS